MSTEGLGRVEKVLESVDFFKPRSTRRKFLTAIAAGGAAAAAGAAGLGRVLPASADAGTVVGFGNAAVGAEKIAVAFYSNALGVSSDFGVPADLAKGTLLNSAHRDYFMAARNQEANHLATLQSALGLSFPANTFAFPAGTFASAPAMLAIGEALENIFIGAYLGAVLAAATAGGSLGILVAEVAAEICGVECAHRVLIRDIAGEDPPNDRFYEGDSSVPGPSGDLGNSGIRSHVYATGDQAVAALLALGISAS
ncbi:MAG TPA: ferritin-like domain-containing protein [Candidatus Dormibacteraeota bacterium]|nr:ferritin-like domain-containing protein [Candidatus Dormibacteraeota bacterium]